MATRDSGQIQVILGPMFSGKSTELLRIIRRFAVAKRRCVIINYCNEARRSAESMVTHTHDRQAIEARACSRLDETISHTDQYDVIGIDQGHLFPDIVEFCERAATNGKAVIVAALDGTFQRKPFGRVLELVPVAEVVVKLTAVCMMCFKDASFTKRIGPEAVIDLVGGDNKYVSVCRECFFQPPENGCS